MMMKLKRIILDNYLSELLKIITFRKRYYETYTIRLVQYIKNTGSTVSYFKRDSFNIYIVNQY